MIDLTNMLAVLDRLTDPTPAAIASLRAALDDLAHTIDRLTVATDKKGDDQLSMLCYLAGDALDELEELENLLARQARQAP